jgi:hypothetical protein
MVAYKVVEGGGGSRTIRNFFFRRVVVNENRGLQNLRKSQFWQFAAIYSNLLQTHRLPMYVSDNLYSRWRRTCTSHVHGVVYCQYLHRAPGALGQATINIIKIINRSTHFINELPYMNFVTVISPVRRLKKLFSYYSII